MIGKGVAVTVVVWRRSKEGSVLDSMLVVELAATGMLCWVGVKRGTS